MNLSHWYERDVLFPSTFLIVSWRFAFAPHRILREKSLMHFFRWVARSPLEGSTSSWVSTTFNAAEDAANPFWYALKLYRVENQQVRKRDKHNNKDSPSTISNCALPWKPRKRVYLAWQESLGTAECRRYSRIRAELLLLFLYKRMKKRTRKR